LYFLQKCLVIHMECLWECLGDHCFTDCLAKGIKCNQLASFLLAGKYGCNHCKLKTHVSKLICR
jgi:hypothetical protein